MTHTDVVRACFTCYITQDRETAEKLYAEDFTLTSPQDDHIDRTAFFERCFPTAAALRSHELLEVVPTESGEVIALYEYEKLSGERHRNAEVITLRDGQLTEVQVFFGGPPR
ncbi:hypothetical protein G5C65_33665 [Streptomyces sp. SB3404]|uniref:SnoaL-like domain-containing protein n=2 Tax=Streptomyces boncukensis TaxID=2711219 RepID=A0A6G4X7G3_9ACTN|nr:hypothetical protein [Streptomyces boncukensis]